jgi:hypothetical protein
MPNGGVKCEHALHDAGPQPGGDPAGVAFERAAESGLTACRRGRGAPARYELECRMLSASPVLLRSWLGLAQCPVEVDRAADEGEVGEGLRVLSRRGQVRHLAGPCCPGGLTVVGDIVPCRFAVAGGRLGGEGETARAAVWLAAAVWHVTMGEGS